VDVNKIKVGKTYPYMSRTVPKEAQARGKVLEIREVGKGHYVRLHDKERAKEVQVRPSQVGVQS
jgi:hypothetical protein